MVVPGGGGVRLKGEPEGEGGAGPRRPLPAAARRRGLLFRSPLRRDPRRASDSGSRPPPPPLPGPRTTPNPRGRRRSGSGCSIPAQLPPPSLPSPLDIWTTLGPAPAPETLPAQFGGWAPRRPLCRAPSPLPDQTSAYPWTPALCSLPPPLPQPGAGLEGGGVCTLRRPRPP